MMHATSSLVLTLLLPLSLPLLAGDKSADSKTLQGHWKLTEADDSDGISKKRGFDKHVMTISGNQMTVESERGKKETHPFKLIPETNPKGIDFRTGGKGKEGQARFGIYSLDGERLRICFSSVDPPDETRRPTEFTTKPGAGRVLLVYTRLKK